MVLALLLSLLALGDVRYRANEFKVAGFVFDRGMAHNSDVFD